jgi:hypothetical protein
MEEFAALEELMKNGGFTETEITEFLDNWKKDPESLSGFLHETESYWYNSAIIKLFNLDNGTGWHLRADTYKHDEYTFKYCYKAEQVGCFHCKNIFLLTQIIFDKDGPRCALCSKHNIIPKLSYQKTELSNTLENLHNVFYPNGQNGRIKLL